MRFIILILMIFMLVGCDDNQAASTATEVDNQISQSIKDDSSIGVQYIAKAKDSVVDLDDELIKDQAMGDDKNNANVDNSQKAINLN